MRAVVGYVIFMMALSFGVMQFHLSYSDLDALVFDAFRRTDYPRQDVEPFGTRRSPSRTFSPASPLFSAAIDDSAATRGGFRRDDEIEAILDDALSRERWSTMVGSAPDDDARRQALVPADGNAMYQLTLDLQRELMRVGCYDGMINGVWTPAARQAMADFIATVNARMSFDRPDYALLALVRGHLANVCGAHCAPNEVIAHDGHCVPSTVLAKSQPATDHAPGAAQARRSDASARASLREKAIGGLEPAAATAAPGESLPLDAVPRRVDVSPPKGSADRSDEPRRREKADTRLGRGASAGVDGLPPSQRYVEPPRQLGQSP